MCVYIHICVYAHTFINIRLCVWFWTDVKSVCDTMNQNKHERMRSKKTPHQQYVYYVCMIAFYQHTDWKIFGALTHPYQLMCSISYNHLVIIALIRHIRAGKSESINAISCVCCILTRVSFAGKDQRVSQSNANKHTKLFECFCSCCCCLMLLLFHSVTFCHICIYS